jgi:type IV pilus assembly protein PilB
MMMSSRIRELTFEAAPTEEIRRAALAEGMKTLYRDGIDKAMKGITTLEEVMTTAKRTEGD